MTSSLTSGTPAFDLSTWALASTTFLYMPLALYAPKAMAVLFVILTLLMLWIWFARRLTIPKIGPASGAAILFVIFASISVVWSPNSAESFRTLAAFAATLAGGGAILHVTSQMDARQSRAIRLAVMAGGILGFLLLAVEFASDGIILRELRELVDKRIVPERVGLALKPGLAAAALFVWPWGLTVVRTFAAPVAFAFILTALVLFVLIASDTAIAGIIIGATVAFTTSLLKRRTAPTYASLFAILILAHPLLASHLPDPTKPQSGLEVLNNSAVHRVHIWRNTAAEIAQAPMLGRGFDATRALYGPESVRPVSMLPDIPGRRYEVRTEPIPLHPHNLTLQIWLETGLIGATLWALVIVRFVYLIDRVVPEGIERFAMFGLLGTAFAIAHVGFGAWQSWWLGALFLIGGVSTTVLRGITVRT